MSEIYSKFLLGDMQACYIKNDGGQAILVLLPADTDCDLLSEKNIDAYRYGSLAHIHLSHHNERFYSNCLKISQSVEALRLVSQQTEETDEYIKIITREQADEGYGIIHNLIWYKGERALVIAHSFKDKKSLEISIPKGYKIEKSLYSSWAEIKNNKLILNPNVDFEGNVYLLTK